MSRSSRIFKHFKSSIVGYLALFMVFSGSAYAAVGTVTSLDIIDGEVRSVDVADNDLTGIDVATNSLTGTDVTDNGLEGTRHRQPAASPGPTPRQQHHWGQCRQQHPHWDRRRHQHASPVGYRREHAERKGHGLSSGKVLGFARVKGTAGIPTFYTNASAAIDITNNRAVRPGPGAPGRHGPVFREVRGQPGSACAGGIKQ